MEESIAAFEKDLATPNTRIETRRFPLYAHYVLALGGDPAKAEAALKRLSALQDKNPNSKSYGEYMTAEGVALGDGGAVTEFTALPMVQIMLRYGDKLSPELRQDLADQLTIALKAIQRQDRRPDLSNVFLINTVDELLIGELMRDEKAINSANAKLTEFIGVALLRGIQEYVSPNQTGMQLAAVLIGHNYTRQPESRRLLDPLMKFLWSQVAANTVPRRGMLGGPHARDTDFIWGLGTVDSFLFLEGLRDQPPFNPLFSDGLRGDQSA